MTNVSLYEVQTFNDAEASENRMHSDEIAQQFGFEAALVPGVTVFGHMTYLAVKEHGDAWFSGNRVSTRFISPAYDRDVLTIEHEPDQDGGEITCIDIGKRLLARLNYRREPAPAPQEAFAIPPAESAGERPPISWDVIEIDAPAPAHRFETTEADNIKLSEQIHDDLALYRGADGFLHPFRLLRECNAAFVRSFILPAWIHVGSDITFHSPVRTGDEVEVRMVPRRKWEKKGHEFVTLYIAFLVDDEVRAEVDHTAIFKIARKDQVEAG